MEVKGEEEDEEEGSEEEEEGWRVRDEGRTGIER